MHGSIVPLLSMWHASMILLMILASGPFVSDAASAQQSSQLYRGVAPEDKSYFRGSTFRCRDGSKTVGVDRLNDDFCDCVDGTDEPGTAACPGGKFYCRNRGHVPLSIFSSRVNDGICDCCDGSDEYLGKAKCGNTCAEAGAENLQKLKAQVATYGEGVKARLAYEEEAKSKRVEWSRDLEQLSAEEGILKKHVQRLQEQKEAVEKAEREEREWKERVEKEKEEAERKKREEQAAANGGAAPGTAPEGTPADSAVDEGRAESSPVVSESVPDSQPITSPAGEDEGDRREAAEVADPGEVVDPEEEDESKLSAEELGARIRARWTGSGGSSPPPVETDERLRELEAEREMNPPFEDEPVPDYHDDHHDEDRDRVEEDHDDSLYDDHDDHLDDRDDDDDEPYMPPSERSESTQTTSPSTTTETSPAATTWWSRMIGSSSRLFRLFSSRPPSIDQSEASDIKQQYKEANDRYQRVQSDVKKLTKQLKLSYGKNDVLLKLYKECFEVKQKQYVYKVCLFDKATQVEGHITTRLGDWQEVGKDHVDTLYFKNGERCWNGPERSMTVKLECGVENKLSSVDEPSRCEYAAVLATPVVCTQSEAQALAKELEERENELKESKMGHDELR